MAKADATDAGKKARRNDEENNHVPSSYEDLYLYYIARPDGKTSLAQKIIRKMLPFSTEDTREALAHDVFLRLMEHNMLVRFNPEKSNFGGVIYFVCRTIVVNHLSRNSRNPLGARRAGSLVETSDSETFEPGVYRLEGLEIQELDENHVSDERRIDARLAVLRLLEFADAQASMDQPAPQKFRDEGVMKLLRLLCDGHDAETAANELGITPSTVTNWLRYLRDQYTAEMGDSPLGG